MKVLSAALLGVAILATALSWADMPASALGGCGPNRHRGPWGGCRWGGRKSILVPETYRSCRGLWSPWDAVVLR
jgi:hypothetical protein